MCVKVRVSVCVWGGRVMDSREDIKIICRNYSSLVCEMLSSKLVQVLFDDPLPLLIDQRISYGPFICFMIVLHSIFVIRVPLSL